MHPLHYPDIERCKKLTEIGFPETEKYWYCNPYAWDDTTRFSIEPPRENGGKEKRGVCPSVMELLDVIPPYIKIDDDEYEFQIRQNGVTKLVMYVCGNGMIYHEYGTLPNALCDLIFWLVENGYLTFKK